MRRKVRKTSGLMLLSFMWECPWFLHKTKIHLLKPSEPLSSWSEMVADDPGVSSSSPWMRKDSDVVEKEPPHISDNKL